MRAAEAVRAPGGVLAVQSLAVAREYGRFKAELERWVRSRLSVLPAHWRKRAAREYARLSAQSEREGNAWLRDMAACARGRLSITADDAEIRAEADRAALDGIELVAWSGTSDLGEARRILEGHCRAWGIEPPGHGGEPAMARMLCARWWLRRLRAMVARECEAAAISARLVCRGVWPYASQDGCERRRAQRRRNALAIERAALVDGQSGDVRALADVVAGSVANPAIRRGELMVRVRGCEEWAQAQGMSAEFWTITTPSRYHAQRMVNATCEPNPHWAGAMPADGQRHLRDVWARARAAWQRRGLQVFGLRVAEPHHDATPHWHVLVFGSSRDLRYARRLLRVYALRDTPDEPGARRHRFAAVSIDPRRGDAAGYVAKYISKNVDGYGVGADGETGRAAGAMARRCDTWAAAWRVRQFQFFGVPPVGAWRALRKMRAGVPVPEVEQARAAADDGDYARYIVACGGCCVPRALCRVWLERGAANVTEYGDDGARPVVAVAAVGGRVPVDRGRWSVRWGVFRGSRTSANNCTASNGAALQGLIDCLEGGAEIGGARGAQRSIFEEQDNGNSCNRPLRGPDDPQALRESQGRRAGGRYHGASGGADLRRR